MSNTLFAEGMIILGQVQVATDFFGKPGEQHIGGFYKNVDLLDLTFAATVPCDAGAEKEIGSV